MTLPRYPAYKDSGVEWLGEIPEHWETRKVSHAFGVIGSGTTPPSSEMHWYEQGTIPWVTTGELRENVVGETAKSITRQALDTFSALKLYPPGSLVIAMYGATIGRLAMLGVWAATNQACCVLSSPKTLDIKFVYYWLLAFRNSLVDLYATGGGQPNISMEIVAGLRIPAPKQSEQSEIVAFLNHETSKIDNLIAEQQNLIALLKEKRQAVISHAVTKGLNPDAPMKDSGVEWLGEVPEHWEVKTLRRAADSVETGRTPASFAPSVDDDQGLNWYTPGDFGSSLILGDAAKTVSRLAVESGEAKVFPSGSIFLVSIGATLGKVAFATIPASANQQINVVVPSDGIDGYFLAYSLSAKSHVMRYLSNASTIGIMNQERAKEICLSVPPKSEQNAICQFLDREIDKSNTLVAEAQRFMALLQERRSALISAAVTGKIDVRSFVPQEAA